MTDEIGQGALFEEPEHLRPRTDGAWLVAPAPDCWRYQLLGEDCDVLMVEGHGIDDAGIRDVLLFAGLWWGDDMEPVPVKRTWAAELDRCPRHHRIQRLVIRPVDWVRYQVFRVLWKLWWSKDPLRQWWRPRWLAWTQHRWHGFVNCSYCEWEQGLRRADRGTDEYRDELVGSYWTWGTDGKPADANRVRKGYVPVTIVDLEV